VIGHNPAKVLKVGDSYLGAFVPPPCLPIYCATKAAIHSYTQSLRFQFEDSGVEIVEIMPPAVKTDMTADLSEGDGITLTSTEELVKHSFTSLKAPLRRVLLKSILANPRSSRSCAALPPI
jgi:short-subunit dehydrogenase involved in D-alanine esterification of teichoic acids